MLVFERARARAALGPFVVQNISIVRITFLTSIAMFGLSLKAAFTAALALAGSVEAASPSKKCTRAEKKWLSIWGSMPQLTEPHNLPPAEFVRFFCPYPLLTFSLGPLLSSERPRFTGRQR